MSLRVIHVLSTYATEPHWSRTANKVWEMQGDGIHENLFGLYELSDDGTVLYSRARSEEGLREPAQDLIGQDFFRDIAPFENTDDLRRHFRRFITSDRPVDTFIFDCLIRSEVVRAKIYMTRAYEHDRDHNEGIVIMDIRKAGQ